LLKSRGYVNIENVVASASFKQNFDLNSLAKTFPSVKYNPEQFPGLIYKLEKPKTTALIFNSGEIICTGARSKRQAKIAVTKIVEELKKEGIVITGRPNVQIKNVVASIDLGGRVDLEDLANTLKRAIYEPEQFPGLIYKMDEPKVVMLVFASGKLVCTGAREEEEVDKAVSKLREILETNKFISYE
jgi:transcription initiation factor TFIID TATA-box-binding protein